MARETRLGLEDVEVRLFAEQLVRELWPHDYLSEYAALLNWVRTHIRYVRDPIIIEQVKTPRAVLETGTGDCDDLCVVLGTLVGTLGGRARYVAGAFKRDPDGGPNYSHVWCEAFDPASKAWVVLDPVPGRNVASMLRRILDTIIVEAA
jgi:transglutaminase-like putative cysteine protease